MLTRITAAGRHAAAPRALRAICLAAFLGLVTGVAPVSAASFGDDVSTFTLDNGLKGVVIPDHRAPVVTHMIWYRVGAADEQPGTSGIAHFLEHLMFKGTPSHPEGEFSRIVSELGGEENAFTSSDYTAYFQRVAKQHLKTMMELEADRMTNLTLDPKEVEAEHQVIMEERRSRVDNNPSAQLGEALDAALYMNSPYGRPIIGWDNEIAKLTPADAIAFYKKYYTPNNAILVVAGDVTADEVKQMAEETYGKVKPRAEIGPRVRPTEPTHLAQDIVSLKSPRVDQESMQRAWIVPSYNTSEEHQGEALDVLAEILGGGSTSRLYRQLVVERQVATAAGSYYQGSALDDTRFLAYAVPRPGTKLEDLKTDIEGVVADLVQGGVTDEEFDRAKRSLIASTVYSQDSQQALARIYGVALTTGSTVEDVNDWIDRVKAVTKDDVVAVAKRFLDPDIGVTGYLRSEPGAAQADASPSPAGGLPIPTNEVTQ